MIENETKKAKTAGDYSYEWRKHKVFGYLLQATAPDGITSIFGPSCNLDLLKNQLASVKMAYDLRVKLSKNQSQGGCKKLKKTQVLSMENEEQRVDKMWQNCLVCDAPFDPEAAYNE